MDKEAGKRAAGEAAARLITDGQTVGLGTGSTAVYFVAALAERVRTEGLRVRGVATSRGAAQLATDAGLTLVELTPDVRIDVTVDGADEVDPSLNLIKGGGGAHVREKIVAARSREMVVIADDSKDVPMLGAFPLPIAVVPFGWQVTQARIEDTFGVAAPVRGGASPLITDDGLYLLDAHFGEIPHPAETEARLRGIVGVVEVGLFVGIASRVLFGSADGTVTERRQR